VEKQMNLYAKLNAQADAEGLAFDSDILYTIDAARVNADDTVYLEKAAPESDWDGIFEGSLMGLLSDRDVNPDTLRWFAAQGIRP
jgi:hypothetical protein